jgi:RHS repeat-associated protein
LDTSGEIAAHWQYDPFGNTVSSAPAPANWPSPALFFPYRFSTKPLDADTGLYYYGYRWYHPATGRWPSRDPIEEQVPGK